MNAILEFPQNTILEDESVLLRPLELTDVDNLLDISLNEPETWEYSLVRANGKENLENYIQLAINPEKTKPNSHLLLSIKNQVNMPEVLVFTISI